ncbi:liprin-beta-1b isoform X1 [Oncorhynchus tshawytscha]|uniref:liprin-beta-1b isoform X1 n=1 Tax=Oncorhynchus tshawytscha TaxID=74940 RepID=UPI000D0A0767|nr:liprin-beta-1b isoform X1 [Oncorhynchus tshawytscha]XP_024235558.1 liprin-beta-1b isoform X1 [Oncorhynchus tshawytscha]XP_024235559.1 liprin-beta-1b isoform X1 [Oncorhynchus tshawytscha]
MMSDASDMLAAALEQMDGIIAGSKAMDYSNGLFDCQSPTSPFMGSLRALNLLEDLRGVLELMDTEEREGLRCQIPDATADSLVDWLQQGHLMSNGHHISMGGDLYQERLSRLEGDKESLVLQVSVLTDQVEAQGEKIRDLDMCLDEHREKLNATEEMLQQELLCRTALETQKQDLMAEVSNLKLNSFEKDRLHFDFSDNEDMVLEMNELRYRVTEMESEKVQYEKKLKSTKSLMAKLSSLKIKVGQMQYEKQRKENKLQALKEELAMLKRHLEGRDGELRRLHDETGFRGITPVGMDSGDRVSHPDETLKLRLKEKHVEVQRMKKAVESLMAANEEKDRKIEELRQSLLRYKKVQDRSSMQGKKDGESDESNSDSSLSVMSTTTTLVAMESERHALAGDEEVAGKSPDELEMHYGATEVSSPTPSPSVQSACDPKRGPELDQPQPESEAGGQDESQEAPLSCDTLQTLDSPNSGSQDNLYVSNSEKLFSATVQNKAVEGISKISEHPPKSPSLSHPVTTEDDRFGNKKARSSFGRGFFKIKGGKRTASTPNLADTEREEGTDHLDLAGLPQRSANSDSTNTLTSVTSTTSPECKKKSKGIKGLFGKLRRSQSTTFNLDDNLSEAVEFKRGGVRATAGPRLGWSRDLQRLPKNDLDTPFARWSKEQVCDWLQEQGLGLYLNMARVWISSGQTLLQGSQQDLERELGIKHPLHRKKLQLALQALGSEEDDNKGKLDYNWVTRWLDDIGLPQYKTQFDEGRVDGRMLHYMTVDDLLSLKVGSVLHHLSIKRAIQVLRLNNYEPNCLRRRPSDENNITPAEISQWTNHRVMEWLRSVDLAEYAPNLRGSGVHGGLMVLEPRFNVETMALLLNIPPNKTLLRRHLATHFNLLVGSEAQGLKQDCLENPDYTLLTATAKVKPRKMSFGSFGSLRKKRQDDSEEYVCPMDVEMPKGRSFQKGYELQLYEDDIDRLEQMEDSEGTVRQIGAFSEGIQNLTSMLKDDEFFKEISNSPNPSITDDDSNM